LTTLGRPNQVNTSCKKKSDFHLTTLRHPNQVEIPFKGPNFYRPAVRPLRFSTNLQTRAGRVLTRPRNRSPSSGEPPLIMAEEFSYRPKDKPKPMHLRQQATDLEKVQSRLVESLAETKRRNSAESLLLSQVRCHNCGILRHYGADCPESRKPHSDHLTTLHAEKPYSALELLQLGHHQATAANYSRGQEE
jgi:hypothetical protein